MVKTIQKKLKLWFHLVPAGDSLEHRSAIDPVVDGLPQLPRHHRRVLQLRQVAPTPAPHYQLAIKVSLQETTGVLSLRKCIHDFPWEGNFGRGRGISSPE